MLKRSLILLLAATFVSKADILTINPDAPSSYVVKKGDTLWDISALYLKDPFKWPKLWGVNPQIKNPHLIYPGDVVTLVYDAGGQPKLVVNKARKKVSPSARTRVKKPGEDNQQKYKNIHSQMGMMAIVTADRFVNSGYVIGGEESYKNLSHPEHIFAKDVEGGSKGFTLVRQRQDILDEEGQVRAKLVDLVAKVSTVRSENGVTEFRVVKAYREIRQGDKVIIDLVANAAELDFIPVSGIEGQIIASQNKARYQGKGDIVVIDKGHDAMLMPGNVLSVYQDSPIVLDEEPVPRYLDDSSVRLAGVTQGESFIQPPKTRVGELVVLSVYDNLSLAVVTSAKKPLSIKNSFR